MLRSLGYPKIQYTSVKTGFFKEKVQNSTFRYKCWDSTYSKI